MRWSVFEILMSQSIPNFTSATLGHLTNMHAWELGFVHINCASRPGFHRGLEVAEIQHKRLIPTENHFYGIHTEFETNLPFSDFLLI